MISLVSALGAIGGLAANQSRLLEPSMIVLTLGMAGFVIALSLPWLLAWRKLDAIPLLRGQWRKSYPWDGDRLAETVYISETGDYYIVGESTPRYTLRRASYCPSLRKLRLQMTYTKDGSYWDTETLYLDNDRMAMRGRSKKFQHGQLRYERLPTDSRTSGQTIP